MDVAAVRALAEIIGPALAVLVCGAIPVSLVFLTKHFKLRTREIELEAEMHGRESQAKLQALETRLMAMEGALGSLVNVISHRPDLMQAPDAPPIAERETPRLPPITQIK
jgi:hypothetical protein